MSSAPHGDPLAVPPETMRALGYRTVDMLVDLMSHRQRVVERAGRAETRELIARDVPADPESYDAIEHDLLSAVLPYRARCDHPGYLAFIPGSATWPGALADFISSALNIDTCWWLGGAGPGEVELVVLDWFKDWIGYPPEAAGVLVSGGSAANITGLACARESRAGWMTDDLTVYVSDETHSSVARAARLLGFRSDQVRILPSGHDFRLGPATLRRAVAADRADGRQPLAVVANGGTTATGSVDPLGEIAAVCRDEGLWLHVDAAYGGFAVLDPRGEAALDGMALADSVTLDPHKWLYQPFECGAVLIRDGRLLRRAFEITQHYLRDAEPRDDDLEVNFSDRGMQLTRSFRALKVWMSLRYFGLDAFRSAIGTAIDLTEAAGRRIEASPRFELLAPPSLGVVAFRRVADGHSGRALDAFNARLVAELEAGGEGFVSSVRLHGRYALRLCILNHATTAADVNAVLDFFEAAEIRDDDAAAGIEPDRDPPVDRSWAVQARLDADAVRRIGLFAGIGDDEAAILLTGATERTVAAGDRIVEEWDVSRELYGVLDGIVRVVRDGRDVAMFAPGAHFGEIAALDWGGGYGYPRLATVEAVTATRLLVIEPESLGALMRASPAVAARIERSAEERRASIARET